MDSVEQAQAKMKGAIDHFKLELKNIRTGRASPSMLDNISVDVYGSSMRVRDVASITVPEPRMLLLTPFDTSQTNTLAKAIQRAELGGVTAIADGNAVRVVISQMDASMRKAMVKTCYKALEDAKVAIRKIRQAANDGVRKQKSEGIIPEDLAKKQEKKIQELTDKFCKEADDICADKEKEISTI
jgi:ribosome recycling factor